MTKGLPRNRTPTNPVVFLPNRAAQKSGLNRAILGKGWGKFLLDLHHQARYTGTQIVRCQQLSPSQRCHQCQHVSAGNRESQASLPVHPMRLARQRRHQRSTEHPGRWTSGVRTRKPRPVGQRQPPSSLEASGFPTLGIPVRQGGEDVK